MTVFTKMKKANEEIQLMKPNSNSFFTKAFYEKMHGMIYFLDIKTNDLKLHAALSSFKESLEWAIWFGKDFSPNENGDFTINVCKETVKEMLRRFRQTCIIYRHVHLME